MPVEPATYISDLNTEWPTDEDLTTEMDDHIRLIKKVLLNTFPGTPVTDEFDQAITATLAQMNSWDARITALENLVAAPGPVLGELDLLTGDPVDVVLGFNPKQIIIWGTTKSIDAARFSYGSFNAQSGFAYPGQFWTNPVTNNFSGGSKVFDNFAFSISEAANVTTDTFSVAIIDGGFRVTFNTFTNGVQALYLAFP